MSFIPPSLDLDRAQRRNVKKIRQDLEELTGKKIDLEIKEIKSPDIDAFLVAQISPDSSNAGSATGEQ